MALTSPLANWTTCCHLELHLLYGMSILLDYHLYFQHGRHKIEDVWSQLEEMNNQKNLKNLRTLIFVGGNRRDSIDLPSWFREVRRLRVLGFEVNGEFRGDISHLVHLCYLDLGWSSKWVGSLSGLFHLKVVFSTGILSQSKSLTELSTSGKLTRIFGQRLEFDFGKKRGVRDLKEILLLCRGGLFIKKVEKLRSEVEAVEVGLEHHQFIDKLELSWGDSERRIVRHDSEEKVVDALKPHPNLKELIIDKFGGRRCPSWLETNWLINLQSLHLSGCKGLEVMPPLGHLPCLKYLYLWSMGSMKRIGMEFYGDGNVKGFPSLEYLLFYDMPAWVEWSAPKFLVFPRLQILWVKDCPELKQFLSFPRAVEGLLTLQELHIRNCPGLKQFPSFPSLSSLEIWHCGVTDGCLSHCLQGLSSLSSLDIGNFNGLTSLPSAEVLHHLTALQEMSIKKCRELASLGGLHALPSLQTLSVTDCARLKSLPEEGLPPSIKDIELNYCNGLTSLPSAEVLHRLTALQEMSIKKCRELASLGGLHALPSLQMLSVTDCDKLKSLPEEGLPPSIEDIKLEGCHPALEEQICKKEGPEWDKIARIPSLQSRGSFS